MKSKPTKAGFHKYLEHVHQRRDERLRIEAKKYEGIRDVDGWDVLEATVRNDHNAYDANDILRILAE